MGCRPEKIYSAISTEVYCLRKMKNNKFNKSGYLDLTSYLALENIRIEQQFKRKREKQSKPVTRVWKAKEVKKK